jgi:hypothetical protein
MDNKLLEIVLRNEAKHPYLRARLRLNGCRQALNEVDFRVERLMIRVEELQKDAELDMMLMEDEDVCDGPPSQQ